MVLSKLFIYMGYLHIELNSSTHMVAESSLGLSNLTKSGDELVFSKTFHTIIINLQFNVITINKR